MDEFCESPFWDTQMTWNTTDPYFTPCFEETVLTWVPAAFLFAFSVFDVTFSLQSKRTGDRVPWNIFTIVKSLITIALVCVSLGQLIRIQSYDDSNAVDTVASVVRVLAYVVALLLIVLSKQKGVRSSAVQFIFWTLALLCEGILIRTAVRKYDDEGNEKWRFIYLMRFFIFPLVAIQFLLQCFADGSSLTGCGSKKPGKHAIFGFPCPEKNSSYVAKLFFSWFDSMAWRGYRNPLDFADLWDLTESDTTSHQLPIFNGMWEKAKEAAKEKSKKTGTVVEAGIVGVLFKCYWKPFFFAGILKLIQDLLPFVSPEILKLLITHVESNDDAPWKGYLYAAILLISSLLTTLFAVQHGERMLRIGMWTRTALSSAVYRKSLYVPSASKKDTSVGEVVNLMSVDTQKIMELTMFIHMVWTSPIQIGLSLYFLYDTLGASIFAGVGVMLLMVPLNGFLTTKQRVFQMEQMKLKDQRVKLMGELLSGMKILKLYGWEPSFQKQIEDIRKKEVDLLRKIAIYSAITTFSFNCLPLLVALATFATYVYTGEDHNLHAGRAFVSLSLFNIMRMPMVMFPMTLAILIQAMVSVNRLNKYLNHEEIDPQAVTHNESEKDPITIRDGTFSWTSESATLKDINFSVKQGSLTAVVGTVGSGKTSLLSALLGDITKNSGSVNVKGSTAYVAQGAWIQNATLKDNILFNDPFNEAKYKRVIEACALGPDLEILEGGDETEIGEKGINLSGGQKQRVALARAAYKESDIYLWDDPLSAVDAHVGKHIFDKLIGPNGCLKNKTRVLVTHGISFLPQVDNIVVLKDGKISEVGTFKELLKQKGSFAEFLSHHLNASDGEEIDESIVQEVEDTIGVEAIRRNSSKILRRKSSQLSVKKAEEKEKPEKKNKLIEEEKAATGNIKTSVLVEYCKACGLSFIATAVFFYAAQAGLNTYSSIWLADWASEASIHEKEFQGIQQMDTTRKYLGGYGGIGGAQSLFTLIAGIIIGLATLNSAAVLHSGILKRVMRAPMSFFDTTPLGRLINRFAKDVDIVDNFVPLNVRATITILCATLSLIANIIYTTPVFTAFIVPVAVLYFFLQRFYVATSRQLKRIEAVSRSPIYSQFSETIAGSTTIRAFRLRDDFIAVADKKIDQNQQAYYPFIASSMWVTVRLEIIGGLIIFASAIFAVVARDSIDSAQLGLSVSSSFSITQLLNFFVRLMSELETNIVAAERINELTTTPQEAPWVLENRPPSEWPQSGEVVFQKYEARYREGLDLVLRGVTCQIHPGEKIGIVGRTGAGKSSLTLALFRLVEPAGGSIHIDGLDITKMGLHDLRSKITIIPQDPVLFSGNLRVNLDPFDAFSDDQVWKCLESAHLKTYVETLPQGLLYEVAEEGSNFSVGQRQLVCLARALLRKTKILVLDEATAAVDLETDDLIQKTIRREFEHATVITIAHRLNTILDSTRVVVLDNGNIVEFDTPGILMANPSSIFYGMAKDAGIV